MAEHTLYNILMYSHDTYGLGHIRRTMSIASHLRAGDVNVLILTGSPIAGRFVLPENVDFAGERIPIDNFDVRESLDREILKVANSKKLLTYYEVKYQMIYQVLEKPDTTTLGTCQFVIGFTGEGTSEYGKSIVGNIQ